MRVVLDTNVLVSALLSPHGSPAQVLQLIVASKAMFCYDARILDEYRQVLRQPKFSFDRHHVDELLDFLENAGQVVACTPLRSALPDTNDHPFLEAAQAGHADFLITGNLRHFPAKLRSGITVVAPAEFLQAFTAIK